jgi:hypothetical protein
MSAPSFTADPTLRNPQFNDLTVTSGYWAFTVTDGAIRMRVVLLFHQLGNSPFDVTMLFLFYEVVGGVTNLISGWLGATIGDGFVQTAAPRLLRRSHHRRGTSGGTVRGSAFLLALKRPQVESGPAASLQSGAPTHV